MTEYAGQELDLFARAERWKARLRREISPFLTPPVLEVGAGLGATTAALRPNVVGPWVCLEPDSSLAHRLAARTELRCDARRGDLAAVPADERFGTILYIDVLEHIADDRDEVARAFSHLQPEGRLVILAPAHQWLYSPFDAAIGHHRRYQRGTLLALQPTGAIVERVRYLDAPGMLLSLGNRLISRQAQPTIRQLHFWDRVLVPLAGLFDPLLRYRAGRSLLVVWRRTS